LSQRLCVLIYSAPQLQECLINLLTYLLTYRPRNNYDAVTAYKCGVKSAASCL